MAKRDGEERRTEDTYGKTVVVRAMGVAPRRVVKKVVRPGGGGVGEQNPGNLNSARLTE